MVAALPAGPRPAGRTVGNGVPGVDTARVGAAGVSAPGVGASVSEADWSSKAVCATQDPDLLFVTGAAQREAAKMCRGCPVRLECLADALDNEVEFGVWGGLTERQRRALLKRNPDVTSWRAVLEEAGPFM